MKYLLLSFKSRNENIEFMKLLRTRGIPSSTINTPHNISTSCTLSLKVDTRYYKEVLGLIKFKRLEGFLGLFLVEKSGLREQTQRLY